MKFLHVCSPRYSPGSRLRNLLVNSNCDLKICDFQAGARRRPVVLSSSDDGLRATRVEIRARVHTTRPLMTESSRSTHTAMASRAIPRPPGRRKVMIRDARDDGRSAGYHAIARPFDITGWVEYTKAVDVWAAGCILAELLEEAASGQHQLELICQCVGRPSMDTIDKIQTPEIREFVAQIPDSRPVGFRALYPQANPLACDLLEDLLVFEPSDRIDVCQALAHPYLEQLHYPDDEPSGPSTC